MHKKIKDTQTKLMGRRCHPIPKSNGARLSRDAIFVLEAERVPLLRCRLLDRGALRVSETAIGSYGQDESELQSGALNHPLTNVNRWAQTNCVWKKRI